MEHTNKENNSEREKNYTIADFLPLIGAVGLVIFLTCGFQYLYGWCPYRAMLDFMGFFFLVFGFLKVANLPGFVSAYQMYDVLAQQSKAYAYAYPFIELALGVAYLLRWRLYMVNWVTLVLMLVSSVGVARELLAGREITCACIGAVFKVPMTYVTLLEDLLMASMAGYMLLFW